MEDFEGVKDAEEAEEGEKQRSLPAGSLRLPPRFLESSLKLLLSAPKLYFAEMKSELQTVVRVVKSVAGEPGDAGHVEIPIPTLGVVRVERWPNTDSENRSRTILVLRLSGSRFHREVILEPANSSVFSLTKFSTCST